MQALFTKASGITHVVIGAAIACSWKPGPSRRSDPFPRRNGSATWNWLASRGV